MFRQNYRSTSLLCVAIKVYERVLEERLGKSIEPKLKYSQVGFRKGRTGPQERVLNVRLLCGKVLRKGKNVAIDIQRLSNQ